MKRSTKICLIVAAACIGFGVVLTAIGFVNGGGGGVVLRSNGKMEYSHDVVTEQSQEYDAITDIKVDVYNYSIDIIESDNNKYKCEYSYDNDAAKPVVKVESNKLVISGDNEAVGSWFNFNFFNYSDDAYKIKIYVPKGTKLNSLDLLSRNGAIESQMELTANTVKMKSSNGKIILNNITCLNKADVNTSSGRIESNGKFKGDNSFVSSNGKVICEGDYQGNTTLDTSNGRIEFTGTFSGEMNCQSSNGAVEFKSSMDRKQCNINAKTSNGSVRIDNQKTDDSFIENNGTSNELKLKTSNGDIHINFNK